MQSTQTRGSDSAGLGEAESMGTGWISNDDKEHSPLGLEWQSCSQELYCLRGSCVWVMIIWSIWQGWPVTSGRLVMS